MRRFRVAVLAWFLVCFSATVGVRASLPSPPVLDEQNVVGSWEGGCAVECFEYAVVLKVDPDKKAVLVLVRNQSELVFSSSVVFVSNGYLKAEFQSKDKEIAAYISATRTPFSPSGSLSARVSVVGQSGPFFQETALLYPAKKDGGSHYDILFKLLESARAAAKR